MKIQGAGLDTTYKCPKCRDSKDCSRGPGREKISIRQEHEQELIQKSIHIDEKTGKAVEARSY